MPGSLAEDRSRRHLIVASGVGAALCLALFGVRLSSAVSFAEPLQLVTSGDEMSSLYALWKAIQGHVIYVDRFSEPYDAVVYNWLFYQSYGWVVGWLQGLLSLGDDWIPTLGRLFTVALLAVGVVAARGALMRGGRFSGGGYDLLCWSFAVFLMFGPLLGFWSMTVRADPAAMVMEASGVLAILVLYPRSRIGAILAAALFAYLGWAFKQNSVTLAGAFGLFLLARRDWFGVVFFSALLIGAWALTLGLGSEYYVRSVMFADYPLVFKVSRGLRNLANLAVKSGPALLVLGVLAVVVLRSADLRRHFWRSDGLLLGMAGIATSLLVAVPSSFHSGASESYYFSLSFFLALAAVAGFGVAVQEDEKWAQTLAWAGVLGWGTLAGAIGLVFTGVVGITDVRDQHARYLKAKACLDPLPRPLFVNDIYLSLPWMTPGNKSYVLSYIYAYDRARGAPFEHDGVGGLIEKGAFETVVLGGGAEGPPEMFDGGSFARYSPAPAASCAGYWVLIRKESP